jgi:hypothetical protein
MTQWQRDLIRGAEADVRYLRGHLPDRQQYRHCLARLRRLKRKYGSPAANRGRGGDL